VRDVVEVISSGIGYDLCLQLIEAQRAVRSDQIRSGLSVAVNQIRFKCGSDTSNLEPQTSPASSIITTEPHNRTSQPNLKQKRKVTLMYLHLHFNILQGASVTLHIIHLGVSGTIYKTHTLKPFKELGLDSQRVEKLASKLHVHSVKFAAKLVHTRRALSSTVINSHQKPDSGQACNPPDPH